MRMRAAVRLVACLALGLAIAGCNVIESHYFREGIGPNLYTAEGDEVTRLQQLYIAHICQQAGLSRDGMTCADMGFQDKAWAVFVQAGMNDIDRRCDAYLTWLDDKKRGKEPLLKQLLAMSGATAAILKATDAGATPIALAAIAFNLASETITNVSSRLVHEIDSRTVNAIVLDNQQTYRQRVLDRINDIDNGPAAMYLLRGYLRICLPFAIETSISNTLTVYHRAGPEALADGPLATRPPESTFTARPLAKGTPRPVTKGATFVRDRWTIALERFLDPKGTGIRDPAKAKIVNDLIRSKRWTVRLTTLLYTRQNATRRQEIARDLKLVQ
jgi:hypothetical protein